MSSIRVSFFLFTLKKPFLYFFSRKNFRGLKIQIFNLDDYRWVLLLILLLGSHIAHASEEDPELMTDAEKKKVGIVEGKAEVPKLGSEYKFTESRNTFFEQLFANWINFKVRNTDENAKPDEFNDGKIEAGTFRYRHLWWTNSARKLIAEASIRWFRTARVYDGDGKYLGKIHKKWFTWFSGRHNYQIYNASGRLVAKGVVENGSRNARNIYLEYSLVEGNEKSDDYGKILVHYQRLPVPDGKSTLDEWTVDVKEGQMDLIGTGPRQVDPRLLVFVAPYSTFWDRGEALEKNDS